MSFPDTTRTRQQNVLFFITDNAAADAVDQFLDLRVTLDKNLLQHTVFHQSGGVPRE